MLPAFVSVLFVLWLLGVGTSFTLGGTIHLLPVIAVILISFWVTRSQRPL